MNSILHTNRDMITLIPIPTAPKTINHVGSWVSAGQRSMFVMPVTTNQMKPVFKTIKITMIQIKKRTKREQQAIFAKIQEIATYYNYVCIWEAHTLTWKIKVKVKVTPLVLIRIFLCDLTVLLIRILCQASNGNILVLRTNFQLLKT